MITEEKEPVEHLVGFWKNYEDEEVSEYGTFLSWPIANSQDDTQNIMEFLGKLSNLESNIQHHTLPDKYEGEYTLYRGYSSCRLCDKCNNGSGTFNFVMNNDYYAWPDGYKHYIIEHGVKVHQEFYDMVMSLNI